MRPLPNDTARFLVHSPYFALLEGKSEAEAAVFDGKYDALPEVVRQFLLSPEASDGVANLVESGTVPPQYGPAVSKLLGMVVMGDVHGDQVSPLLVKLGLPAQSADSVAQRFTEMLKPVTAARIEQIAAQSMRPIQPLTRKIGVPVPPPPVPQGASRNILDLHDQSRK
jgi:hypothetical protein